MQRNNYVKVYVPYDNFKRSNHVVEVTFTKSEYVKHQQSTATTRIWTFKITPAN
jgi:hypothetical protein